MGVEMAHRDHPNTQGHQSGSTLCRMASNTYGISYSLLASQLIMTHMVSAWSSTSPLPLHYIMQHIVLSPLCRPLAVVSPRRQKLTLALTPLP